MLSDTIQLRSQLRAVIESLEATAVLPELTAVFDRAGGAGHPDWEIPIHTCVAAGGQASAALPAAAAIACLQISIMIVDDMLDEDPRGIHLAYGVGRAANLAQAFQAAAFQLVDRIETTPAGRNAIASSLAQAALATAAGQHLDVSNLTGETNYWRVIRAKSTPFYGTAYQVGALVAGVDEQKAHDIHEFGLLIGEIIQLEDDLVDAFEIPANADWHQGRNNLLVLFATSANHGQRAQFEALLPLIRQGQQQPLQEAQQILLSSGAVSYCVMQLVERYRAARRLLDALELPAPAPLTIMLDNYRASLLGTLRKGGVEITAAVLDGGE